MYYLVIVLLFTSSLFAQKEGSVKTVKKVDLNKYIGLWYEISRLPNKFQDQCVKNVTAKYSLRKDGSVSVVNSCVDDEGKVDVAEGKANVVDKITNAQLEVSFVSIFGINLFYGDYWIIGLADDYSYAVVGTPNRKYAWILSRTKKLPEDKLKEAQQILAENKFDLNKLQTTIQE